MKDDRIHDASFRSHALRVQVRVLCATTDPYEQLYHVLGQNHHDHRSFVPVMSSTIELFISGLAEIVFCAKSSRSGLKR